MVAFSRVAGESDWVAAWSGFAGAASRWLPSSDPRPLDDTSLPDEGRDGSELTDVPLTSCFRDLGPCVVVASGPAGRANADRIAISSQFGRTRLRRVMPDGASGFFSRSIAVSSDILLRDGKGSGCWIVASLERSTPDGSASGALLDLTSIGTGSSEF